MGESFLDYLKNYVEKQLHNCIEGEEMNFAYGKCPKLSGESKAERKERVLAYKESPDFKSKFSEWIKRRPNYIKYASPDCSINAEIIGECCLLLEKEGNYKLAAEGRTVLNVVKEAEACKEKDISDKVEEYLEYLKSQWDLLEEAAEEFVEEIADSFRDELSSGSLGIKRFPYAHYGNYDKYYMEDITKDNLEMFLSGIEDEADEYIRKYAYEEDFMSEGIKYLKEHDPKGYEEIIKKTSGSLNDEDQIEFDSILNDRLYGDQYFYDELDVIEEALRNTESAEISRDEAVRLMSENPRYSKIVKNEKSRAEDACERERRLEQGILDAIPENPIDLYPLARRLHRKWILHIGPTNSGKTHDAMQALESAESGIYLAPLRLLAFEGYSRMNGDGVLCSLITGEEEQIVEGANHISSTMEMLDTSTEYEVAVIDEAQMAGDTQRGGAWTAALLGVRAKTIHICAAPQAEDLLLKLAEMCGDETEVVHHTRQTELIAEKKDFKAYEMEQQVHDGDALIVFSKRSVLSVAAALQNKGVSCSIIYGALPYEVRQKEAERFANGETKVVVATDAIGMGMNLPIRRIVFLEQDKYDGKDMRPLLPEEIQQIAGRAGRRGMFDQGYYVGTYNTPAIKRRLEAKITPIKEAYLGFDKALVNVDGKLSEIMKKWQDMENPGIFRKQDIEEEISLCLDIEHLTDGKRLVFQFVTIPFNADNAELKAVWEQAFRMELKGKHLEYTEPSYIVNDLQSLENAYGYCDLMYYYQRKFTDGKQLKDILRDKKKITEKINRILASQKLPGRKCKYCGKPLPWNYSYSMCQKCHDNMYGNRWYDDYGGWY